MENSPRSNGQLSSKQWKTLLQAMENSPRSNGQLSSKQLKTLLKSMKNSSTELFDNNNAKNILKLFNSVVG